MEAITQAAFTTKDALEGLFLLEPWKATVELIISPLLTTLLILLKGRLGEISRRDKSASQLLALECLVVNYYVQFQRQ